MKYNDNWVYNTFNVNSSELGKENVDFIVDVLNRRLDAYDHIVDLAIKFHEASNELNDSLKDLKLYKAHKELEKLKVFLFKQRHILIAVPQRKRHHSFPAPNLGGLVTPQNYRLKGEVCYGMPHAEARNWLVEKALSDPEITDLLFVDDDILLPLDAISKLANTHESIIGANYVKKNFPIETCALQIINKNSILHNIEIQAKQEELTPIPVSQMGMGACLINIEVFKKIERPWFEFIYNKDGTVFAGEDVRFCQKAILAGFSPKIIPGLVPIHVDFRTGKHWGPDFIVKDHYIKKELIDHYCHFQCDPKECL